MAAAKRLWEFLRSALAEFKDGKQIQGQYRADDDDTLTGGNS